MHTHDSVRQTRELTYVIGHGNACSHLWKFTTWRFVCSGLTVQERVLTVNVGWNHSVLTTGDNFSKICWSPNVENFSCTWICASLTDRRAVSAQVPDLNVSMRFHFFYLEPLVYGHQPQPWVTEMHILQVTVLNWLELLTTIVAYSIDWFPSFLLLLNTEHSKKH